MAAGEQRSVAYSSLNPQRMVPGLILDDGRVIAQSIAIIDFLDRLIPDPAIYPSDPVARAQAMALALYIACETAPLQTKAVRQVLAEDFGFDDDRDVAWITRWIHNGLSTVERFLAKRSPETVFALGDRPGIVDICAIPQFRNAKRFGVATAGFPLLRRLEEHCLDHSAFKAALPDHWVRA